MPDDDDLGADPGKPENRNWPDAGKSRSGDIFREDDAQERIEKRERDEREDRRDPDDDG